MKTHTMFNLVSVSILVFSLLGMPAPVLATSRASVQSAPFTTCADVTEIPQAECEALIALYNSTDGAAWLTATNWLTTNTPCSWLAVYCDGNWPSHVTGLDLLNNHLNGSIPSQLGNLTQITFLRLSNNLLSGSIPVELGDLSELQYLTLSNNQLSGSIPGELGNLTQLINLDIQNNQFTGSIPAQLGNLTQLKELWLRSNQLSGSIPEELGNLSELQFLTLSGNQLSGSVPPQLGNLTQLKNLELVNNQLSGNIPAELGNLTLLEHLWLQNNQLSGSIPSELGNLIHLVALLLSHNQLTGNIPAELGNLTQLQVLELINNQLSGNIPPELGNLTQLTALELYDNQLSGNIPPELGNLTRLIRLHLHNNQLTGSIPPQLGNLTQLTELSLGPNQLTGGIPSQLGNLTQLTWLNVGVNQLSGSIPVEVGNLTQLTALYLHGNLLSGEFPASITNLVNLTTLTFDCGLTSSDPVVIAFLKEKSDNGCFSQEPHFSVIFPKNEIHGYEWPMGANITLSIDDPSNGTGVDYSRTKMVGTENFRPPFDTWINFQLGDFAVKPGDIVTMTDGTTTKTHITQEIAVTNIDPMADTVSGTAAPGIDVGVNGGCDNNGCAYRNVPVDASGHWLADFSVPGDHDDEQQLFDIQLGSSGEAQRIDEDGDGTIYDWNVGDPRIFALLEEQRVYAWGWFAGTLLTLTIENPATPQSPDYIGTQSATAFEDWDYGFDWGVTLDVQPGYLVTVSGGGITKELAVAPLTVTSVDIDADTVSGTGDPGFEIHVGRLCDEYSCTRRNIYVDANGNWLADFSVPGQDDDETVFDIRPGSGTGVYEIDEDNDATNVGWNVPNHTFSVRANDDWVEGFEWILGSTITIEIDDPATQTNPDYTDTVTVRLADWDPSQTHFGISTDGYDLKLGDIVTASDGDITKQLIVTDSRITDVDLDNDIVRGTAQPNQNVDLWTCWQNDPCVNRNVRADQNGNWSENFGIAGNEDWEQETADLRPGSWIDSSARDEDGDGVMFGWYVDIPNIEANPGNDWVVARGWPNGTTLTLTIDDPSNGLGVDKTMNITMGPSSWDPNDIAAATNPMSDFDLQPGHIIKVTDGVTEASYVPTSLAVTDIDLDADTISGTALPGVEVEVRVVGVSGPYILRYATSDALTGNWTVDYAHPGQREDEQQLVDLQPDSVGFVKEFDANRNATHVNWQVAEQSVFAPFVVFGQQGVWIKENSEVLTGDVGVNMVSGGPYLADHAEVTIGQNVRLLDPASRVLGDTVYLRRGSEVYDVYYNEIWGLGDVLGNHHMPLDLPLVSQFPEVPQVIPGTQNYNLPIRGALTLAAGNYGKLEAKRSSTITFTGGIYNFREWNLGDNVKVYFAAPTEIRIAGKLDIGANAYVGPATSSSVTAHDIFIYVLGVNGNNGRIGADPKAAKFGIRNTIQANVYAPNGTLWIRERSTATGAFFGKWVTIGENVTLTLDNGWK